MTTTTSPFFPSLVMQVWGAPGRAQYVGHPRVWEDVGAQNIFTPESFFAKSEPGGHTGQFHISLSVSGTFAATVTLAGSPPGLGRGAQPVGQDLGDRVIEAASE